MTRTLHTFRLFSPDDPCDRSFTAWSRIYEYPAVLAELEALRGGIDTRRLWVHNAAAGGFLPCHWQFMAELDRRHDCLHTDAAPSGEVRIYDICDPDMMLGWCFDAVLCVSTLEHLPPVEQRIALVNLAAQVRPGGRLILTFDLPGADLELLEELAGRPIDLPAMPLCGSNSRCPQPDCAGLVVGILSLTPENES